MGRSLRELREQLQALVIHVIELEQQQHTRGKVTAPPGSVFERRFTATFRGRQRDLMNLPDEPEEGEDR